MAMGYSNIRPSFAQALRRAAFAFDFGQMSDCSRLACQPKLARLAEQAKASSDSEMTFAKSTARTRFEIVLEIDRVAFGGEGVIAH